MLSSLILSSDLPKSTVDYIKLYNIPENYKMNELVTLHQVIREVALNGTLPLMYQQYWGIIVNESDIFYECASINKKQDFIKTRDNTPMKRVVVEYILATHLQDHNVNLDEY
jgi:hypothetical protein